MSTRNAAWLGAEAVPFRRVSMARFPRYTVLGCPRGDVCLLVLPRPMLFCRSISQSVTCYGAFGPVS